MFGYVFHVCDCVIVCYKCAERHIHDMMFMGNAIVWLLRGNLYTWHNVYRKKKWNSKVRNDNLRGSKNEMNLKVLNFIEINKRSGWQVAPLK